MSWLSDIAGRAEDLLNRVDKSAAGALQKTKNGARPQEPIKNLPFVEQDAPSKQPLVTSNFSTNPPPLAKAVSTTTSVTHSPPRTNRQRVDQDEQLLEFLNSPESSKPSKKSPPTKRKKLDEIKAVEVENDSSKTSVVPFDEGSVENPEISDDAVIEASEVEHNERADESALLQGDIVNHATDTGPSSDVEPLARVEANNKLLQNEVLSLSQEIKFLRNKCEESDGEIRRLQKKSEHWNSQVSTSDHMIRELEEKESDLTKALDAKDSQLAVLRVRFQETDQDLMVQRTLVETLRNENEKLLKDLSDSGSLHLKTMESLQEKVQETELALRHEQEARKLAEVESLQRFSKLEEEQKSLTEALTSVQKKYMDEKALTKDQGSQLKNLQAAFDLAKQDLAEYRQKAQRILQSKEKLIATLKESHEDGNEVGTAMVESVETEELRQERDGLKEELQRANASLAVLRSDLQSTEQSNRQELEEVRRNAVSLEQQLQHALQSHEELQLDFNQLNEELRYVREDLTKTKTNLQMRIKDRDAELEKLRKQLTTKQLTSSSQGELESRIRALTENLIQKQTLVEALSTEKNSLVMQLERMEQKIKDTSQVLNSRIPTHVGITLTDDDSKTRFPVMMAESPYDNTVTRRVKRAYSIVDSFSVRLGVFLRHYPIARIFVIFYMVLLHLWVMVVLLTYQPEIHGSQKLDNKTGPK